MQKALFKCAIVGGVIVFLWGMISWMLLPWHGNMLHTFTNESKVAEVIQDNAPKSGIYVLPNMYGYTESTSQQQMMKGKEIMEKGPVMFASIQAYGVGKMGVRPFIFSLVIQVVGAFIVTWMLFQTKGLKFKEQVGFVTLFGLGVAVLGLLPAWNWWGFSTIYTFTCAIDLVIGWFLAGLAIAKLCKK